jgi:hypothetical protein
LILAADDPIASGTMPLGREQRGTLPLGMFETLPYDAAATLKTKTG